MSVREDKFYLRFITVMIILLFLAGAAMAAVSAVPYDLIKGRLGLPGGSSTIFTAELYGQICLRLRFFGGAAALLALLCSVLRKRAVAPLRALVRSAGGLAAAIRRYPFREVLRREAVYHVALLLLTVAAALVRIRFLNQPLKFDEAGSYLYSASRPAYMIASYYVTPNNHILHTLLMRCSYLLFGGELWALRLPAFLSGLLLVPASYAVVRRLAGGPAALLTAALVASSPFLIGYSTNGRGYSLLLLFFLCLLFLGTDLIRGGSSSSWFLLALCASLGLYTIPVMLYPCSVVFCWLFLGALLNRKGAQRKRELKKLCASLGLTFFMTLLLYLPVFVVSGFEAVVANRFVLPQSWGSLCALWPSTAAALWDQLNLGLPLPLQLLLVAALPVCILLYRKLNLLLLSAVLAPLPFLLIQEVAPPPRVWIAWAFIYYMAAAGGLGYLVSLIPLRKFRFARPIYAIIIVALAALLSLQVLDSAAFRCANETGTLREGAEIAETLAPLLEEGDCILAPAPSDAILEYYLSRQGLTGQYLWADIYSSKRLFVLVNESYSQTLYEVLTDWGVGGGAYSVPRIRGSYRGATLYELSKR